MCWVKPLIEQWTVFIPNLSFYTQSEPCVLMLCFENPVSAKGESVWMSAVLKKAAGNNTEVTAIDPYWTCTWVTWPIRHFHWKDKKTAPDENIPTVWPSGTSWRNDIYASHFPSLIVQRWFIAQRISLNTCFSWCLHCMIFTIYLAF